ncbi:benzoate/H(+) symporter BenE family transporter [Caulobacter segnis]|uniref:benzoate/H(+) symporter BenE family transporter n=1 Tax=Caulobacter segnis TaxID=88688 RepID=UPI00285E7FA2|nr:benzoate/H(+) symporter BenE family transporter [Caulobacter segnis]MDR6625261.1 benzoate membrane transport protein [Caulobacter segnis]
MTFKTPPVTAWSAALIAALIGFGGTVALVVQAMKVMGASPEETGSAVTALCLAIGLAGGALSVGLRMPVVLAWSTPGAALLAGTTAQLSWPVAVGVFVISAVLAIVLGLVPVLGRLAERIPSAVASAMLAGVLLPFCLTLFRTAAIDPLLVGVILAVFLAARQRAPLYAMLLALTAGVALTLVRGGLSLPSSGHVLGMLAPQAPLFQPAAIVSLALPLFLVTLVSQNLPGLVVLRTAGYRPPPRPLLAGVGLASLLAAPFGAHGVNLAAITAAICTNPEAHPDAAKRWVVGVIYAGCYLLLALFSPFLVGVFLGLPHTVIAALTGLALIPALLGALESMLAPTGDRDPAIVTFLATASGLTLLGVGSAFWGLAAGFLALGARALVRRRARADQANPT